MVDFPVPLRPTRIVVVPGWSSMLKFWMVFLVEFVKYLYVMFLAMRVMVDVSYLLCDGV